MYGLRLGSLCGSIHRQLEGKASFTASSRSFAVVSRNPSEVAPANRRRIRCGRVLTCRSDHARFVRAHGDCVTKHRDREIARTLCCVTRRGIAVRRSPLHRAPGDLQTDWVGEKLSPHTEPYGRFSRIRLSSWVFHHRDRRTARCAVVRLNKPTSAK